MIRKLAHLDRKHQWMVSGGLLTATALLCYFLITHGSVSELYQASSAKKAMELKQQDLELVNAELEVLEKTLARTQSQAEHIKTLCCSEAQAALFFERLTTWASDFRLTPISRVVSSPQPIMPDPNGIPLIRQSADIVLQGYIQDMIAFLNRLMERPQKVCITNLRVGLPPGENFKPRASFRVVLVIDPTSDGTLI
jgi:hypothetical protein